MEKRSMDKRGHNSTDCLAIPYEHIPGEIIFNLNE